MTKEEKGGSGGPGKNEGGYCWVQVKKYQIPSKVLLSEIIDTIPEKTVFAPTLKKALAEALIKENAESADEGKKKENEENNGVNSAKGTVEKPLFASHLRGMEIKHRYVKTDMFTMYGGYGEVGGVFVLMEDKGTRILFDVGKSFTRYGALYEEFEKPRTHSLLKDLILGGILPPVNGIYRKDLLEQFKSNEPELFKKLGLEIHEKPSIDGILISHAHLDHVAFLTLVDPRVTVYCSEETKATLQSLQESGRGGIENEYCTVVERVEGKRVTKKDKDECSINREFCTNDEFSIKHVKVKSFSIDHSILGARGYILEGSKKVGWMQDWRRHGRAGKLTDDFIEKLKALDYFITESTRFYEPEIERNTEATVLLNSREVIKNTKGLVIMDFSARDLFRFDTIMKIAKDADVKRELAIITKQADFLTKLSPFSNKWKAHDMEIPDLDNELIKIYIERKVTGTYELTKDYGVWERGYVNRYNVIKAADISANPRKYILCLGYYHMNELNDIRPPEGSIYIHSASEAWNEEQLYGEWRLDNWLDGGEGIKRLGYSPPKIPRYQFHASGHGAASDFSYLYKRLHELSPNVKVIINHTEHQKEAEEFVKSQGINLANLQEFTF